MKKDKIMSVALVILVSGVSAIWCDWNDALYMLGTYNEDQSFASSPIYTDCNEEGTEDCQILRNALVEAQKHFQQLKLIDALQNSIENAKDPEAKAILLKKMEIKKEKFPNHSKTYLETLTPEELEKLNKAKENLLLSINHTAVERECSRIRELLDPKKEQ